MRTDEFRTRLRHLLTQQPFAPFRVVLTTGESFVVDERGAIGHNGTYHFAGFAPAGGPPYFFDPRNVVDMTSLADTARAG